MQVDFGKAAGDYAQHRVGFPEAFFQRLFDEGLARTGELALDLGTGTGVVARGLALRGCAVTGLDPSEALLAQAAELDRAVGVQVRQVHARVEDAEFPDASFDLVTAGQCWHWFDRPRAAALARRWLRPGGRLVIAHFDWLPLEGNLVHATEELIRAHNPAWTLGKGNGLYPAWLTDVREAGFRDVRTFSFDVDVPYSHLGWRGRIRASAGVGASMAPAAVERFDAELAALLSDRYPAEPMAVPHCVWVLSAVAPG
ncbi:methyltransferase domain-containing protein [Dyella sp. BiH032]|uniref:class I SAM-dependent methyltransferase n=1 Tax=Dyella sp. BiH032 TaxID=3075430 RepID=UPI002892FF57|nr:methyltransferase domain-containing protein [Dyella sp. BiH032]WNL45129.1 methyltransferase domain-containing protein [Dyella sp. BiH032]